jgi:hypothetical protein
VPPSLLSSSPVGSSPPFFADRRILPSTIAILKHLLLLAAQTGANTMLLRVREFQSQSVAAGQAHAHQPARSVERANRRRHDLSINPNRPTAALGCQSHQFGK